MQQKKQAEGLRRILHFVGQHLDAVLITMEGTRAGVSFEHNLVDGCIRSVQCDADFVYQNSICSRVKKNSTNTSWPVAETSGCILDFKLSPCTECCTLSFG
jgi:hypothetical protein